MLAAVHTTFPPGCGAPMASVNDRVFAAVSQTLCLLHETALMVLTTWPRPAAALLPALQTLRVQACCVVAA